MELQWIDAKEAEARLNAWGAEDRPFFFLTDYLRCRWLVEPIAALSADELLFAFPGYSNAPCEETNGVSLVWQPHPLRPDAYREKFEIVHLAGRIKSMEDAATLLNKKSACRMFPAASAVLLKITV